MPNVVPFIWWRQFCWGQMTADYSDVQEVEADERKAIV